jgi:hypothetical protein
MQFSNFFKRLIAKPRAYRRIEYPKLVIFLTNTRLRSELLLIKNLKDMKSIKSNFNSFG